VWNRRKINFALISTLLALAAVGPVLLNAAGKQPKKTDGGYRVTVGGFYTGTGTADVRNKKVTIRAEVRSAGGGTGTLNCPNLKLDGDHFSGTGNLQGTKLTVRGRLDGYADDPDFRGARILCTYTDDAGNTGRIAGVLQ
jgi:hypothetical protein